MTSRPDRIPFTRSDPVPRHRGAESFWRAATALVLGKIRDEDAVRIIDRESGRDDTAGWLTRAAVNPLTSTDASGSQLTPTIVTSVLQSLARSSAAARLFDQCLRLDFTTAQKTVIPRISTKPVPVFVAEGSSAGMVQAAYDTLVLGPPRKMLFGAVVSQELEQYAFQSALAIVTKTLINATATQLDAVVFDAVAASALRPAGLLNGVSTLTPTTGTGLAALSGDLAKICAAMATAGINADNNLLLIADPASAVIMRTTLYNPESFPIIGTPALAVKTLVGVAPDAIATGFSGLPEVEVSKDAMIQMDTAPTDNVITGRVISIWQMNMLALKLRMRCLWSPLMTGAVQLVSNVGWA